MQTATAVDTKMQFVTILQLEQPTSGPTEDEFSPDSTVLAPGSGVSILVLDGIGGGAVLERSGFGVNLRQILRGLLPPTPLRDPFSSQCRSALTVTGPE